MQPRTSLVKFVDLFVMPECGPRFPISTKEGASYITPSTGFGGALAFLASCSQVTLYGYSSYAMPGPGRNGDIQVHMPSLAEQTLMLKVRRAAI